MMMSVVSTYKSFCIASRCLDFESGGCAAAPFFLLLAQKKEGKEKGTLLTWPSAALRFLPFTARKELGASRLKHLFASPVSVCDARHVRKGL